MAWFTCVKGKTAGLNALLCFGKREQNYFLRHVYRNKNVSVRTLGTLRTALNVSFIHLKFSKQQPYTAVHAMETKDATIEEESCDTDSTVKTNCGKRKNEETDEAAKQGNRKKQKKCGKQLRRGERYVPPPQKRNPGVSFSQEHFAETSYYFEGGLRKVYPYYFDFTTYCKGRWIGKTLLEVFKNEFRAESMDYYNKAVKEGRIKLNGTPVDDLNIILKVRHDVTTLIDCNFICAVLCNCFVSPLLV